jgi:hypothetical protein
MGRFSFQKKPTQRELQSWESFVELREDNQHPQDHPFGGGLPASQSVPTAIGGVMDEAALPKRWFL